MPIEKFRSLDEMNRAPARAAGADFDRFLRHCQRFWRLAPRMYPRGVYRFRSISEARHPDSGTSAASVPARVD